MLFRSRNALSDDRTLSFYKEWLYDNNSTNNSQIFIEITRWLWKLAKIPYYDFTFDSKDIFSKEIDIHSVHHLKCDLARDQLHYGYKTQELVGLEICKKINTLKEKEMPIQTLTIKGEKYYRWGDHGKLYRDRADAEKQAQAAYEIGRAHV